MLTAALPRLCLGGKKTFDGRRLVLRSYGCQYDWATSTRSLSPLECITVPPLRALKGTAEARRA